MLERFDLGKDAYTDYDPQWLDSEESDDMLASLLTSCAWEQRAIVAGHKEVMQPRLIDWGGDLPYRYSGQTLEPRPLTGLLGELNERVSDVVGVPFNHVLLNRYRDGRDHMGMHTDAEFELGQNPTIAALSLGVSRHFVLRPKFKGRKHERRFLLAHGSLLVMGGTLQHRWRHGVPKMMGVSGERINVTFRRLMGPPGWRWWGEGERHDSRSG